MKKPKPPPPPGLHVSLRKYDHQLLLLPLLLWIMAIRVQCMGSITFPDDGPLRNSLVTPGRRWCILFGIPRTARNGRRRRRRRTWQIGSLDSGGTTTKEVTTTAQLTGGWVVDGGGSPSEEVAPQGHYHELHSCGMDGGRGRGRSTEDVKLDDKSNQFAVCGDSELGLI